MAYLNQKQIAEKLNNLNPGQVLVIDGFGAVQASGAVPSMVDDGTSYDRHNKRVESLMEIWQITKKVADAWQHRIYNENDSHEKLGFLTYGAPNVMLVEIKLTRSELTTKLSVMEDTLVMIDQDGES